ncbi:MAG TPA: DUF4249 domain-containing protein [Mucilaginibacter sp.]|jgi:hypothetical protein|nr:DUF4249 domain-containing protein [Mucilaginibacter sp.]
MRSLFTLFCVTLLCLGCKKPFFPALDQTGNKRYLVVEGVITGSDPTNIKLSRTKLIDTSKSILPETGAVVTIENDANATIPLTEIKPGIYTAAPFNLDPAHKYRLDIKTSDAKEYVSDYVVVKNSPPVDSIGFVSTPSAMQVSVSAHDATNATRYYRWDYSETWRFHSWYISEYGPNGARLPQDQVYYCFANDTSASVLIASTTKLQNDVLYQAPITTVDPASEKIELKYSILIKQYALTPDAYGFWENLQKNTQKIGNIFDVLPSQSQTNYHCVTDPGELVVGYLSVGNVSYKRAYITKEQLPASYKTVYPVICEIDTVFTIHPPETHWEQVMTDEFNANPSAYTVIQGLYIPPSSPFGGPTAYTYSTPICGDCSIRGTNVTPQFWK